MKQVFLGILLGIFTISAVAAPTTTFAKNSDDDDRYEYRYDDDKDEDEDEDDWEDDRDDDYDWDDDRYEDVDSNDDELEVEADVFTDTTIVKVELRNGKKSYFRTTADTRAEVIDEVAERFNLSEAEVDDALELEFEDRASRTKERAKITYSNNRPDTCDDTAGALRIEADVFTDTTVVKVEFKNGDTAVFETDATTSADIIDVIADRYSSLSETEIDDVLDREVEDRESRAGDFRISGNSRDCDDDRKNDDRVNDRLKELQRLIEALIRILNERA